ncbi:MAG: acyltransferase family protein [Acidimicrobiales bacterium]
MPAAHRLNNFDLIRLIAALEVVIGHSVEFLDITVPSWLAPAYVVLRWFPGVPVFFALSGWLLTGSLERRPDLRDYTRNRVLRLFPALWVCVLVTMAVLAAAGLLFRLPPDRLVAFVLAQLTIGQTWAPSPIDTFGLGAPDTPNMSLWTIRVEVGFYIALPILLLGGRRLVRTARRLDVLLLLVAAASFVIQAGWGDPAVEDGLPLLGRLVVNSPAPYLWLFVAGALMRRHQETVLAAFRNRTGWWLVVFLAARGLVYWRYEAGGGSAPMAALGVANLLLLGPAFALAFSGNAVIRRLRPPIDISYGVYLWHGLVINVIVQWALATGAAAGLITIAAAVLLGTLSWYLVEAPALNLKRSARSAPTPRAS